MGGLLGGTEEGWGGAVDGDEGGRGCLGVRIFFRVGRRGTGGLGSGAEEGWYNGMAELGARLQNNIASRACASFSNDVASHAIAYFSTTKIRVISLSCHRVSR